MSPALELWGGAECTVNRIGDRIHDQIERTRHPGHDVVADIGFKALRIPVLWERVAATAQPDWAWSDRELAVCRREGIRPIVGLLHHGSGPPSTDLLDPGFPAAFAAYARDVAQRYPWVRDWTPINEPLTTARFSGLYGHWYPHCSNNDDFLRCLLHQLQASVLAMREIRRVIPRARSVHTEDLGRATASPRLQAQCVFENERRWLSCDLLCGVASAGVEAARRSTDDPAIVALFDWLLANPSPPDVVGINHYVTSNRHLDDRVELFPDVPVGGNGRQAYVDVEGVRVRGIACAGFEQLLVEAWDRMHLPLALTEVHMQGTVHEQRCWLESAWNGALAARARGIPVLAVTAWGLFGHVDWHNLVTREENIYAAGVFDTAARPLQASPLFLVLQALAAADTAAPQPSPDVPGWWKQDHRFSYCIASPATPASQPRFT